MSEDLPGWLAVKVSEYVELERKAADIHDSIVPIGMCQYLSIGGGLMALGVGLSNSASPFYVGAGAMLAIIFGFAWWYQRSQLGSIYQKQTQIADLLAENGYTRPFRGEVQRR